jgi:D-alanine-D-alanine ligase
VPGEIIPSREFYDYESKYLDEGSRSIIPADLPANVAEQVRRLSIEAFKAIDGAGMSRVDFLLSRADHALFVNEINTIPGFTTISMFAKLWAASGLDYPGLLDRLIALAIERHDDKQQLRTSVT